MVIFHSYVKLPEGTSSQQMGWSELTSLFRGTTIWSVFRLRLAWSGGCWNSCLKQMRRLQYSNHLKPRERWVLKPQQSLWECFQWGLGRIQPTSTLQFWSSWVLNRFWRLWRILQLGAARSWHAPSHQKIQSDRVALPCPISCLQASPKTGWLEGPWRMMPGWSSPYRSAGAWSSM